ncbi:MAG: M28 family peptidase [Anaerolineae bacterium]|nr:M28 family peptidase [Gemmatimonadaceae bacterium]
MRSTLPTAILFFATALSAQRPDSLGITTAELGARLRFFSSDLFEGRAPGTRGEKLTTEYLVSELQSFGVNAGATQSGDSAASWLQPVSIVTHAPDSSSRNEARVSGRVTRALEHGRDIRLSNSSGRTEVRAGGELIFVGYGIHAPMYGWDDFAGVDMRGKIAVALFGEPAIAGDTTRFNGVRASRFSWTTDKAAELERRGAVGVLWIRPAGSISRAPVGGSRRLAPDATNARLLFTGILTDSAASKLLPARSGTFKSVLESAGRRGFRSFPLGVRLDVDFRTRPRTILSHNVVGVVPGRDARLGTEHVVLSAHWDAYGIGAPVNGDSIYNGALDDGSGTTALLALARVFAKHPQERSLTFLFTTAEEWGLLGAHAFVCDGPLAHERIVANLNVDDGIELMGVKRDAAPLGIELSTLGANVAQVAGKMGLRVSPDPYPEEGYFLRADNFPFARAGIPALYMGLGTDAVGKPAGFTDAKVKEYLDVHYHRPSDDYDTVVLDLEGAKQFAEFVRDVTISVANGAERPTWLKGAEFQRPVNKPNGAMTGSRCVLPDGGSK